MNTFWLALDDFANDGSIRRLCVTSGNRVDIIITSMRKGRYLRVMLTGVAAALILIGLAPAGASSANISHPYKAISQIPDGSIVSLSPQHNDYVELANISNGPRLLGVAVASNDSLIAVDPGEGKVQVATSGTATVLVSTLNGSVNVGDQVAVSPFNGVGMKALDGSRIVGLAQTAFSHDSPGATTEQVKDKSGHATSVQVGYVQVNIAIGTNGADANLNSLQRFVKQVTGRTVSNFRIITSLVVASVALVALAALIYASIYGGIISVGRNPLAQQAVFHSLGSVLAMAAITAAISGGTIFLLLR